MRKALETVCLNFNKNQLEKLSSYWVCKARLAEAAGDAQEALSLYEHAVRKHTQVNCEESISHDLLYVTIFICKKIVDSFYSNLRMKFVIGVLFS